MSDYLLEQKKRREQNVGPEQMETEPKDTPFESSLDLLAQLRDEVEAEQTKAQLPQNKNRKFITVFGYVLASLFLVVLVVIFSVGYNYIKETAEDVRSLEEELKLETNRREIAEDSRDRYRNAYRKMQSDLKPEYDFYHEYACIVTKAGEKYHRYGCSHLSYDSFWIYNVAAAESRGYEPCSDCWDNTRKTLDGLTAEERILAKAKIIEQNRN